MFTFRNTEYHCHMESTPDSTDGEVKIADTMALRKEDLTCSEN